MLFNIQISYRNMVTERRKDFQNGFKYFSGAKKNLSNQQRERDMSLKTTGNIFKRPDLTIKKSLKYFSNPYYPSLIFSSV